MNVWLYHISYFSKKTYFVLKKECEKYIFIPWKNMCKPGLFGLMVATRLFIYMALTDFNRLLKFGIIRHIQCEMYSVVRYDCIRTLWSVVLHTTLDKKYSNKH